MQDAKLAASHAFKIFRKDASAALKLLRQGKSKQEILAETGATVGVHDASFEVQEGEIFVIMGLFGSGKSAAPDLEVGGIDPEIGQSPSSGRLRKAFTFPSISSHRRLTWLLEMPDMPIALTRSSTERVEMPCT